MTKIFSEKLYRKSIEDMRESKDSLGYNINQCMLDNCKDREYQLGVVIGRDGLAYRVSITWLEDKK